MATALYTANYGVQTGYFDIKAMYFPVGTYVKALPTDGVIKGTGTIIPAIDQADFDAGASDGVAVTVAGWLEFYISDAECDVADSAGSTIAANTQDQSAL